jgi:prevent-host-death family protein
MLRLSTSEFRKATADVLNRIAYGGDRLILHRHGKDVAVVLSVEEYAQLRMLEDAADRKTIARAKKASQDTVAWENLKRDLDLE